MTYWLRKFKVLTMCWRWKHESSKILALGVPNAESYARPATCVATIKKCRNAPCKGIDFCHNPQKNPEFRAEIQDLKKVVKELEKKQEKAKSEFDVFSAARQRAANSFFSVMRHRLRKQNYIKYVDRSALDKGLHILKKALATKFYWTKMQTGNCHILSTVTRELMLTFFH